MDTFGPAKSDRCPDFPGRFSYIKMYHLGPLLGVCIMQVSTFLSVLIKQVPL